MKLFHGFNLAKEIPHGGCIVRGTNKYEYKCHLPCEEDDTGASSKCPLANRIIKTILQFLVIMFHEVISDDLEECCAKCIGSEYSLYSVESVHAY